MGYFSIISKRLNALWFWDWSSTISLDSNLWWNFSDTLLRLYWCRASYWPLYTPAVAVWAKLELEINQNRTWIWAHFQCKKIISLASGQIKEKSFLLIWDIFSQNYIDGFFLENIDILRVSTTKVRASVTNAGQGPDMVPYAYS